MKLVRILFILLVPMCLAVTLRAADQPARDAEPLFNGKDLSNWWGDMSLWHVEDGQIVGKTQKGIRQNEFLKSKRSYGDFRLVVKMKLVPNSANSGIQFHSEPFHGNEMSGPQADAGKGY